MSNAWTTEWPTEPGWYWCYGDPWNMNAEREPEQYTAEYAMVLVLRVINGVILSCNGSYFSKSTCGKAIFMRVEPPKAPVDFVLTTS